MPQIPTKIKPTKGFSHSIHIGLNGLLPLVSYVLVRIDFVPVAILLIFLSKWRIFAVKPRYWMANIVSSGVDIMASIAFVIFMASTASEWWQLFWVGLYIGWLVWLKPRSDVLSVSAQAMIGQLLGLSVLYLKFGDVPLAILVLSTWAITYLAARHFLTSFEEPYSALLAHIWAFFSAGLTFILGHWLLFYGTIPQIIVILTTLGYSLAALYYLEATERLNKSIKRQLLIIVLAVLAVIVVLSDWTGSTV